MWYSPLSVLLKRKQSQKLMLSNKQWFFMNQFRFGFGSRMQVNQPLQTQGKAVQNDPLAKQSTTAENKESAFDLKCSLWNEMNEKTSSHCFLSTLGCYKGQANASRQSCLRVTWQFLLYHKLQSFRKRLCTCPTVATCHTRKTSFSSFFRKICKTCFARKTSC